MSGLPDGMEKGGLVMDRKEGGMKIGGSVVLVVLVEKLMMTDTLIRRKLCEEIKFTLCARNFSK